MPCGYDPEEGRFLTQDTYRGETDSFETWHLYAYCANNPIKYTDPSGHSAAAAATAFVLLIIAVSANATTSVQVSQSSWRSMDHSYFQGRKIISARPVPVLVPQQPSRQREGYTVPKSNNSRIKPGPKAKRKKSEIKSTPKAPAKPRLGGFKALPKGKLGKNKIKTITNKEADQMAKKLGFRKTNQYIQGQRIYKKGRKYITIDVDSHNGGIWKMANTIKDLGNRKTRSGTYDKNLNRIGD